MPFQTQFQVWAEVFFRLKTRAQEEDFTGRKLRQRGSRPTLELYGAFSTGAALAALACSQKQGLQLFFIQLFHAKQKIIPSIPHWTPIIPELFHLGNQFTTSTLKGS
jgi:hypothetical protein